MSLLDRIGGPRSIKRHSTMSFQRSHRGGPLAGCARARSPSRRSGKAGWRRTPLNRLKETAKADIDLAGQRHGDNARAVAIVQDDFHVGLCAA